MSGVFGIALFLLLLLFCFVLLVNSAIVSHHLLGQSGSYFNQIKAGVDPVYYWRVPVASLRLRDKLLISSIPISLKHMSVSGKQKYA